MRSSILKSKINKRINFTDEERRALVESALAMGRDLMEKVVRIVQPKKLFWPGKGSLMEFYLDDILIESFALPANATGRIGLINAADTIGTLKAWN